jgi:hypothetical protein
VYNFAKSIVSGYLTRNLSTAVFVVRQRLHVSCFYDQLQSPLPVLLSSALRRAQFVTLQPVRGGGVEPVTK